MLLLARVKIINFHWSSDNLNIKIKRFAISIDSYDNT